MKLLVFLFLFFISRALYGQDLLVNGGFEDENICTEYNVNCAPEAWISNSSGFNNYFKDANRSYAGSHCLAIEAGHSYKPYQRTFICSQFVCGMKKGNRYRLEFYIKSQHPVLDSIGVYFGPIDPLLERKPIHKLAPSLFLADNPENQFRKDSSWQKAILEYTARGDEAFITISNFSRNDITGPTGIDKENHFFVFLDEVSLVPLNPDEKLCADWQQTREEIYDQNMRHGMLERYIQYSRSQPVPVVLTSNTVSKKIILILPDVLFASGKADLFKESYPVIDSFVISLKNRQIDSLVIEGHTDNTGSPTLNEQLSLSRANTVGKYISQQLQPNPLPMIIRGRGAQKPVADNQLPSGRQQNRRVEVFLFTRE